MKSFKRLCKESYSSSSRLGTLLKVKSTCYFIQGWRNRPVFPSFPPPPNKLCTSRISRIWFQDLQRYVGKFIRELRLTWATASSPFLFLCPAQGVHYRQSVSGEESCVGPCRRGGRSVWEEASCSSSARGQLCSKFSFTKLMTTETHMRLFSFHFSCFFLIIFPFISIKLWYMKKGR